jgi:hypothetical protein
MIDGAGVATGDAVTGVVVEGNHFSQHPGVLGDWGIWAVHDGPYESPGFDIENNEFGPLTSGGVWIWGPQVVDRLINNNFHDISLQAVTADKWTAPALLVNGDVAYRTGPFPVVRRARGNTFFANDVGVEFRSGSGEMQDSSLESDFGTAADPGGNTFRCNSVPPTQGNGQGVDVFVDFDGVANPPVTIPFEGNTWDHTPPTTAITYPNPAPGTDLWYVSNPSGTPVVALGPTIDNANASAATTPPCPAGRVPGP